jgi:hypothetical protein
MVTKSRDVPFANSRLVLHCLFIIKSFDRWYFGSVWYSVYYENHIKLGYSATNFLSLECEVGLWVYNIKTLVTLE